MSKEQNRQEFSEVVDFIDTFKSHFGSGVKVRYVEQDGKSKGTLKYPWEEKDEHANNAGS